MRSVVEYIARQIAPLKVAVAVDFTMGNGRDTLSLSNVAAKVYSFDIQEQALEKTQALLDEHHVAKQRYELILANHFCFDDYLEEFDLGIFNLGYLPGGDHRITTIKENTIATLEKALVALKAKGTILIGVYVGHDDGLESAAIKAFCARLNNDFNVSCYQMLNKQKAPYVIMIEKIK